MKKKIICILLCSSLLLSSCSLSKTGLKENSSDNVSGSVTQEEVEYPTPKTYSISDDGIITSEPLPNSDVEYVPHYYQEDYSYNFGYTGMANSGCMISCLAMAYSYYTGQIITPDIFAEAYSDYIGQNGTVDDALYIEFAKNTGCDLLYNGAFDLQMMSSYIGENDALVILQINHKSIYSNSATCMLTTGTDGMGNMIVYDPIKSNRYLQVNSPIETDKPMYDLAEVVEAIGLSGTMVVFGWKEAIVRE